MERLEGPVIAVNVRAGRDSYTTATSSERQLRRPRLRRVSAWARLAVTGVEQARPNLLETISRSVVLGSARADLEAERHADLVIAPAVADIDMLSWSRLEGVRDLGAQAARAALAAAPPSLRARTRVEPPSDE
jgi:predicted acylesterase/phospholipase RssA